MNRSIFPTSHRIGSILRTSTKELDQQKHNLDLILHMAISE